MPQDDRKVQNELKGPKRSKLKLTKARPKRPREAEN